MKKPKVLVYCGIHECTTFKRLIRRFDICYGIEADPRLAAQAQERFAGDGHVHIVHAAVCEENGFVLFNLHNNRAASSLGRVGEDYRRRTGNEIRAVETVRVPAINLYDLLVAQGIDFIDLYQSDIQGMDFVVLNTLYPLVADRRIRMIRCETELDAHAVPSYEGLPSNRQALFRELLQRDYRICARQKVGPNWAYQDVTWKLKPRHLVSWHLRRMGLL